MLQSIQTDPGAHPDFGSSFTGIKRSGYDMTSHLHQVSMLRLSGAVRLLPQYAVVTWTGTALEDYLSLRIISIKS
jgi:hypothetical protein